MKKLFCSLLIAFATVNAMADSLVTYGDVNVLKDASAAFCVEFDFSNTIVEGKPYEEYVASRPADWQRDWPNDREAGRKVFVEKWNKKNKKGMKASTSTSEKYRMVIKPTTIHFGSAALAWTIGFGAGGMKMSGTMELYDGDTKLLTIEIVDQTGKSELTETKRFKSLMNELADDTYKDILK